MTLILVSLKVKAKPREPLRSQLRGGCTPTSYPKGWFPLQEDPVDGSELVTFDYMEQFMLETFRTYGVPEEEAKIATDVLLEADKRGISSHGIGRLKPIYCDRIDAGIMAPTAPFTVVRDAGAMALVDGNMGLGLTVGPRCMEMAIKKAKSFGVGLVIARRSTYWLFAFPPPFFYR